MMSDALVKFSGGLFALAIVGYAFVYAPMKRNHDECGQITLCDHL